MVRHARWVAAIALLSCGSSSLTPSSGTPDGGTSQRQDGGGDVDRDGGSTSSLVCPTAGAPSVAGTIDSPDSVETSGIVASAKNEGVFWIHNDSGDSARVFAISKSGKLVATLSFDTTKPRDIEDIAIEDAGDASFLYLGDIGDNDSVRSEVVIHRVTEPKLGATTTLTTQSEKMTVVYPDGAHNAETLLFDPKTKELFIATKKSGGPSAIHRVGPFQAGQKVTTEKVASVDVDTATGGDISRDGTYIAIRNYSKSASLWLRNEGESVADALAREPCNVPIASEMQGEAFGFLVDASGYVTTSEGSSQDLHLTVFQ